MLTYYVKTDEETGYIADITLGPTEGYDSIELFPSSKELFTRFYTHYRIVNGVAKPGDPRLPDVGLDHLYHVSLDQQAELIKQSTTGKQAVESITTLAAGQSDLAATDQQMQQAITTLAMSMGTGSMASEITTEK